MDLAYDHIVEESLPREDDGKKRNEGVEQTQNSLNAEIQDAYKAFSASPWGAKIGGFFGTVVKQVRRGLSTTHLSSPLLPLQAVDVVGRRWERELEPRMG